LVARHPLPSCHLNSAVLRTSADSQPHGIDTMAEPQLSVRSAKARNLAHRLARRERRSVADVVERALEAYQVREAGREPAEAFYARLSSDCGTDLDLEVIIRESRQINPGPEL
jgi:hypothetical protein